MNQALWTSKTGLAAQDTKLATISNNMANAATTGFKRDNAVFEDLMYQVRREPGGAQSDSTHLPSGLQVGTGVRVVGTQKEFTAGNIQVTDNELDIAIVGRGFFEIQMPDGSSAYTRDGSFQTNAEGKLVMSNGMPLQPEIIVPEGTASINISKDGIVQAIIEGQPQGEEIGSIQLVDFINPAGLRSMGGNVFTETAASGTPLQGTPTQESFGRLEQGNLEGSNVDVVEELVGMITTQRTYEMNSKVISTADQMLQFLTQNL